MSNLTSTISSLLPPDWLLHNLIFLDPDWQANICDGEHVVTGTGETIETALTTAATKTYNSANYTGRLISLPRLFNDATESRTNSLLSRLGLIKPKPKVTRRI